jgi:hypothetical protein
VNGSLYRYMSVPRSSFQELHKSTSKGEYFQAHIRNQFDCERIVE